MNKKNEEILKKIKGGLIVSCQALSTEPLYDSYIMSKMAYAAMLGGAVGIRANTIADIKAIKKEVDLPIIGIIKEEYDDSDVYISPTMKEIDALIEEGCDIIATDATKRLRPGGKTFEEFFIEVRKKYPEQLFMADTSCFEEGELAAKLGYHTTTYQRWEESVHSIKLIDAINIADFFGVSLDYLAGRTNCKEIHK